MQRGQSRSRPRPPGPRQERWDHAHGEGALDSDFCETGNHTARNITIGAAVCRGVEQDRDAVCHESFPGEGEGAVKQIALVTRVSRRRRQYSSNRIRFQDLHSQPERFQPRP